jgi:hypothetical protein
VVDIELARHRFRVADHAIGVRRVSGIRWSAKSASTCASLVSPTARS